VEALSQNVASMLAGDASANSGDALRWIQLHQAGEIKVGMCRRVTCSALTTANSVWRLPAAGCSQHRSTTISSCAPALGDDATTQTDLCASFHHAHLLIFVEPI